MAQGRCPDPAGYERAQYLRVIQSYPAAEAPFAPGPW